MMHVRENKDGEEGFIAAEASFCLNTIRVLNWEIIL